MASRHGRRVAIVTGASSGIGAAVAEDLTHRGWLVAGLDLNESSWATSRCVDVSDEAAVREAVREVRRELGQIGAAVTAAGQYRQRPFVEITGDQWYSMIRTHLGGMVNVAKAVLPDMIAAGRGSIVAITSDLAVGGGDQEAHYAAAKGAVIGVVRSLALEVAESGVRVNAVAPGPTDTPMIGFDSPWRDPDYLRSIPLQRLAAPAEVARAVSYLVEEAEHTTGEVLSPNCGTVI